MERIVVLAVALVGCSADAWRDALQGQPANLIIAAEQVVKPPPSDPFARAYHESRLSTRQERLKGALLCTWLYLMKEPASFSLGDLGYASDEDGVLYRRVGDAHEVTLGDIFNDGDKYKPQSWRFVSERGEASQMELKNFQTLFFPVSAFPYVRCVN